MKKKEEIRALEESMQVGMPGYFQQQCPPLDPDVPMVIQRSIQSISGNPGPKIPAGNPARFHCGEVNCSIQSYAPALHPLRRFGITQVLVCTLSSHLSGKNLYNLA